MWLKSVQNKLTLTKFHLFKATVQVEQKEKRKSTMPSMVELYDEGDELLEDDVDDPPFVPEGGDVDDDDDDDEDDADDVVTKNEPLSENADFIEWKSLESMIYSHIIGESEKGDLRCKICDYHSKNNVMRDVARHIESRHINLTLQCPYCEIKRRDRRMLKAHIRKYSYF